MTDPNTAGFSNPALRPGSADYYVVRFSPPGQRERLARWFAWFALIDDIATRANDPGVARLKLDWWREECAQLPHGQARHPIARDLCGQVKQDWQVRQMHRALDAIEERILRRQPADLEELQRQCANQHASRLALLCDTDNTGLNEILEQLAQLIGTVQRLQRLGSDARDDHLALPADLLSRHRITLDALNRREPLPQLHQAGEELLQTLPVRTEDQCASLRREPTLHPALRTAAQDLRLAHLLRKHHFATHQRHLQLTPLSLLWHARRMR